MDQQQPEKKRAPKNVTVDYKNGKIYKLVNDINDKAYIGSTTTLLSKRFNSHKTDSKRAHSLIYTQMKAIGPDHFRIILVENFPCGSKAELLAREYAVMKTFDKPLLLNTIYDGKHGEESRKKMAEAKKGMVGAANNSFQRGCITRRDSRYVFTWQDNGKQMMKSYTYGAIRTPQEAYMKIIDVQNSVFPLTIKEYLNELPCGLD